MSNLLSLSLTDMSFNNFESLKTPEIINMLVQKGGEFEYNNTTNLIIGIALLAVGGVIFIGENNYLETDGYINYLNCNNTNCSLGVQYQVNGNTYKKEFTVSIDYVRPSNNKIQVTYESSDPNNSYMGSSNYNSIIYAMFGGGIFFIILWYYLSTSKKESNTFFVPSLSIYTKTETPSGLYVISKK
jgi:hypothetical protein